MNRLLFLVPIMLVINVQKLYSQTQYQWKEATAAGYKYKYVSNDPAKTRFYTLANGLSVILSPNSSEPRINMQIAVRSGSTNDPADHTGLAHYLEHLLFKGTDKYGTLDWAKEKPLIDQIEKLYTQYNSTTDVKTRRIIYHQIDSVSYAASKFSIAGEYDKIVKSLGSQGSNAQTKLDETIYYEDVPANVIQPLIELQAERFRAPVFRLFHTELEAVYEEKNSSLDNDKNKPQEVALQLLFPGHKYGTQTTIGTIEHLKNPSITAIRNYYNEYYVPNNMALILVGDLNPDEVIKLVDRNFSYMKRQPVQIYKGPKLEPIKKVIVKNIYGPSTESVSIVYRGSASGTRDAMLTSLVSSILNNGKAGLIDLNINQQQKVLSADLTLQQLREASLLFLSANPKKGQSLYEAQKIVTNQLSILKRGDFEDHLISAIIANKKLAYLQSLKNNRAMASALTKVYTASGGDSWSTQVAMLDEMSKVSKKELIEFSNRFFRDDNYAVIYKHRGIDSNIVKVEKPPITPIVTNAGKTSPFATALLSEKIREIAPVWVNFDQKIQKTKLGSAEVLYVYNKADKLFQLTYRFSFGKLSNKKLEIASNLLEYIGTPSTSRQQINKRLYELASRYSFNVRDQATVLTISGLQENFSSTVALVEDLFNNCTADEETLINLKSDLLKSRSSAKQTKGAILGKLQSYALYGPKNPGNNVLSDEEINALGTKELTDLIHELKNYQHEINFYGSLNAEQFCAKLASLHRIPEVWIPTTQSTAFNKQPVEKNSVLFVNYDMVQADLLLIRNNGAFNVSDEPRVRLFNEYFGLGMGSIVNSTIRDSKALAYSTYVSVEVPSSKDGQYSFVGYVQTQADKVNDVFVAMKDLLTTLPQQEKMFGDVKQNVLKSIATERINDGELIEKYFYAKQKGLDKDIREFQYEQFKKMTLNDVSAYHKENLADRPYTYCVIASDRAIPPQSLEKYGPVKILTLKELFGY